MNIQEIGHRISLIEKYRAEIKVAQQAMKDELEQDELYIAATAEAKTAAAKKKQIQTEITHRVELQRLLEDIRINREEIATLQEILSAELVAFQKETNQDEIADEDGKVHKFKITVKLVAPGGEERFG